MSRPESGSGTVGAQPEVGPLLKVADLRISVRTAAGPAVAVHGVDFTLEEGATHGLVGESGSGKTLTARALMGLLPKAAAIDGGRVLLHGRNLLDLSEKEMAKVRGRELGMTFQDPATYVNPVMRVGKQVAEVVRRHRPDLDADARVFEMFELVRLPDPREVGLRYPHELSGGMRQRVLLAMALAASPRILIADEPTTALDVTIQADILDLLRSLCATLSLAVLLISHDLSVVSEVCDEVTVLYAGKVQEVGQTSDMFQFPLHPYTEGLVASTLVVHEKRSIRRVIVGDAPPVGAAPSGCRFHPRCPYAFEPCSIDEPPLQEPTTTEPFYLAEGPVPYERTSESERLVRCWLHHE